MPCGEGYSWRATLIRRQHFPRGPSQLFLVAAVEGEDPEQSHPHGQAPQEVEDCALFIAVFERVVEEDLLRLANRVEGVGLLGGHVDLELEIAQTGGKPAPDLRRKGVAAHVEDAGGDVARLYILG